METSNKLDHVLCRLKLDFVPCLFQNEAGELNEAECLEIQRHLFYGFETPEAQQDALKAKDEEIQRLNDKVLELTEARDRLEQENGHLISLVRTQSRTIQSIRRRRGDTHGQRSEPGARSLQRQATQKLQGERLNALQAEVQKQSELRNEALVVAKLAREQIQELEKDAEAHAGVREELAERGRERDLALARVAELERLQETPVWPTGSNELSALYAKLAQACDDIVLEPIVSSQGYRGLHRLAALVAEPLAVQNLKALARDATDSTPRCLVDVCQSGNMARFLSSSAVDPDAPSSPVTATPAVPTAAMPMPGGALQTELLDALDGHASLYEFCLGLPQLAEALRQGSVHEHLDSSVNRIAEAIDRDEWTG
ncbi:hypothetical protein CEP52_003815 [Fusarium oligoseptatum]|uniref:Uncharacterized protein n=1 Tax=Fusarium oligoseptatum TaxID=2604345 RepID=A0A428U762_9HYPO|nr:hypothetical protein CEP52_003815 [Fusarium oligoseptatum]